MKLIISSELTDVITNYHATAYSIELDDDYNPLIKTKEVDNLLNEIYTTYPRKYVYEDIVKIDKIKELRDSYKKLGKDPSHTRPAPEALLRRVVKGIKLYRIGDVIDLGNILSLYTFKSVCVADLDEIVGDVRIRIGKKEDSYYGIGRSIINVENIPVYVDDVSPFGSPTSDCERTMIKSTTKKILVMINGTSTDSTNDEKLLVDLFTRYIKIKSINKLGE